VLCNERTVCQYTTSSRHWRIAFAVFFWLPVEVLETRWSTRSSARWSSPSEFNGVLFPVLITTSSVRWGGEVGFSWCRILVVILTSSWSIALLNLRWSWVRSWSTRVQHHHWTLTEPTPHRTKIALINTKQHDNHKTTLQYSITTQDLSPFSRPLHSIILRIIT